MEPGADIKCSELLQCEVPDVSLAVGRASDIPVVVHNDVEILCQPNIQLDHIGPINDGLAKRSHRIFRCRTGRSSVSYNQRFL
jgi:hypothetical protein